MEKTIKQSVRIYYHLLKKVIKLPERKERQIDETKLKLENRQIFVCSKRC